MTLLRCVLLVLVLCIVQSAEIAISMAAEFRCTVLDDDTKQPIPCRVYLRSAKGEWLFVGSTHKDGTALRYEEQWVPMPGIDEKHTTVSAHPFHAELPIGEYWIEIERGKEYHPFRQRLSITNEVHDKTISLKRWTNQADLGWFSGETHVHRRLSELPNVMVAEDLNVAFPVTFWTTRSDAAPDLKPSTLRRQGPSPFGPREDRGSKIIAVAPTHVVFPRNTEYEIFSVNGKSHVLGALFLLNHRSQFDLLAPPIGEIVRKAHAEGALLDLDKHNWPWSLMLVANAEIDLFELSNNSVWRAGFGFRQAPEELPDWLNVEKDGPTSFTEWGWLEFGWKYYYALLNCGFRMSPTAGTASGVHPVPLGYSRVYVHTGPEFDADQWLAGLKAGRSFVTTGPMLDVTVNGRRSGETLSMKNIGASKSHRVQIVIDSLSEQPVSAIEIVRTGDVVQRIVPALTRTPAGAWRAQIQTDVEFAESGWVAVRSIEPRELGRRRFAHTAPWYIEIAERPQRPRRKEVEYFIKSLQQETERNRGVLAPEALQEFEAAVERFSAMLPAAK